MKRRRAKIGNDTSSGIIVRDSFHSNKLVYSSRFRESGRTEGRLDGQTDGRTEERRDGRTDRRQDERIGG